MLLSAIDEALDKARWKTSEEIGGLFLRGILRRLLGGQVVSNGGQVHSGGICRDIILIFSVAGKTDPDDERYSDRGAYDAADEFFLFFFCTSFCGCASALFQIYFCSDSWVLPLCLPIYFSLLYGI